MEEDSLVIGIDIGTGGVRVLAATLMGEVVATANADIEVSGSKLALGWHEQNAEFWWVSVTACLSKVVDCLGDKVGAVAALAVDATSGTVVCLDDVGSPVRPALMYNDSRSELEAQELCEVAAEHCDRHGYRFTSSFGAAKIAWLIRNEPDTVTRTRWFCHQADFIVGRLTGEFGITDYSNALKTGYDLFNRCWPPWIDTFGNIRDRLPKVISPGERVGELSSAAVSRFGLPNRLVVVAGATDGTAGFLASGAHRVGDDNTTLGTTLVFKRLVESPIADEKSLLYSHRLPGGYWLPGAASNTGAEWIRKFYDNKNPADLDEQARQLLPSELVAYPLARTGERFPFFAPTAEGFCEPDTVNELERYAANLQGVAFTERLGYEILNTATDVNCGDVFATGAAARSNTWLQLRADVTGRTIHRPTHPESAFGSAVLAATTEQKDIWANARAMVQIERSFVPQDKYASVYEERFAKLKCLLEQRGYLSGKIK